MSDSWTKAFSRAVETEKEGAKDFEDFAPSTGKRGSLHGGVAEGEGNGGEEDLDSSEGGYSQPIKLAKFVQEAATIGQAGGASHGAHSAIDALRAMEQGTGDKTEEKEERNMAEVCGRQICRSWLKFKFLKLGGPCPDTCMRKHEITCKPEQLYKDYSFKGLSAKQRKDILQQLKS
jgi:hypothetical protein